LLLRWEPVVRSVRCRYSGFLASRDEFDMSAAERRQARRRLQVGLAECDDSSIFKTVPGFPGDSGAPITLKWSSVSETMQQTATLHVTTLE